ncbi:hypothetical protein vseg_006768 [Gypsophila vaccaria]
MSHLKPKQILGSSKEVALGLLESIATLAYMCAKYTRTASLKLANVTLKLNSLKRISSRPRTRDEDEDGLWRKSILMGDKCEPLDFSGVIYYDCDGNMLSHIPVKSPRASPFPRSDCLVGSS